MTALRMSWKMENKILTLLGFASKSGKLGYGFSQSLEALNRSKAMLIITALDVSPKSKKEIGFYAQKKSVDLWDLKNTNILELSNAVGHKCGIISVNDQGFAKAIKEEILNDQ